MAWLLAALLALLALLASKTGYAAEVRQYRDNLINITACHIDLQQDTLHTFWRDSSGKALGNFSNLRNWLRPQGKDLLCATNAGIYDKTLRPLGLYIEDGLTLRKLNTRQNAYGNFYMQPNGVFIVEERQARITDTNSISSDQQRWLASALYATQSGPIMLQNGVINSLFDSNSNNLLMRNAVCVISAQKIILAIARSPINFYDFAQFLRDKLHCVDALYLDGNISRFYPSLDADIGPSFGPMIGVLKPLQN